mgnify:CR=1 FL=1
MSTLGIVHGIENNEAKIQYLTLGDILQKKYKIPENKVADCYVIDAGLFLQEMLDMVIGNNNDQTSIKFMSLNNKENSNVWTK